jgi:hypothetical protein
MTIPDIIQYYLYEKKKKIISFLKEQNKEYMNINNNI